MDVSVDIKSSSELFNKLLSTSGLNLVLDVLLSNGKYLLDGLMRNVGLVLWNNNLLKIDSEIVLPEVHSINQEVKDQNWDAKWNEEHVVQDLLFWVFLG